MVISKILEDLVKRKKNIEEGNFNCLPLPFKRFKLYFPGFEQGKYFILTANQKIGKSKLMDFMMVYSIILFKKFINPDFKYKILYFTLEMSKESKYLEFISFLLYYLDRKVVSPTDLKSTDKNHLLGNDIIELIKSEKYQDLIKIYEETVEYIDDIKHPTGILKYCEDYAKTEGHIVYSEDTYTKDNGVVLHKIDHFEYDNPSKYNIVIIDNAANLTAENGQSKMETIDKLSKYLVYLRNRYNFLIGLVQHQAQSQESLENIKFNKIKPSTDGLADCKTVSRDFLYS